MNRGAQQATVHGIARVRHDLVTKPTTELLFLLPTSYISDVPMTPSLGSMSLLEQLTELRKPIYSLVVSMLTHVQLLQAHGL